MPGTEKQQPDRLHALDELHRQRRVHREQHDAERIAALRRLADSGVVRVDTDTSYAIEEDVRVITGPVPVIDIDTVGDSASHPQAS